jgi:hypothetical protein
MGMVAITKIMDYFLYLWIMRGILADYLMTEISSQTKCVAFVEEDPIQVGCN